jgi:hypothetical protein
MNPFGLATWQGRDYETFHRSRINLLLYVVAVPLFWAGGVLVVYAVISGALTIGLVGALLLPAALAVQSFGHKHERTPPIPFTGPANALGRLLLEQGFTYPRFVLSGQMLRSLFRQQGIDRCERR